MVRIYSHLAPEEHVHIEFLNKQRLGPGQIGAQLGRDPSTISRELARNRRPGATRQSRPGGVLVQECSRASRTSSGKRRDVVFTKAPLFCEFADIWDTWTALLKGSVPQMMVS